METDASRPPSSHPSQIPKGWRAEIELFPEGEFAATRIDRRPVARIRLAADRTVKKDPLFAQITQRRTNREELAP